MNRYYQRGANPFFYFFIDLLIVVIIIYSATQAWREYQVRQELDALIQAELDRTVQVMANHPDLGQGMRFVIPAGINDELTGMPVFLWRDTEEDWLCLPEWDDDGLDKFLPRLCRVRIEAITSAGVEFDRPFAPGASDTVINIVGALLYMVLFLMFGIPLLLVIVAIVFDRGLGSEKNE